MKPRLPKTTGGKGLHVVLPIRPTLTWDDAGSLHKAVADFLVRTFPGRFTATMAKDKRKGKMYRLPAQQRRRDGDRAVPSARAPTPRWRRRSTGRNSSATCASITSRSAMCRNAWRDCAPPRGRNSGDAAGDHCRVRKRLPGGIAQRPQWRMVDERRLSPSGSNVRGRPEADRRVP
jgi:hypothetical protein